MLVRSPPLSLLETHLLFPQTRGYIILPFPAQSDDKPCSHRRLPDGRIPSGTRWRASGKEQRDRMRGLARGHRGRRHRPAAHDGREHKVGRAAATTTAGTAGWWGCGCLGVGWRVFGLWEMEM